MLPTTNELLSEELTESSYPSKIYRMNIQSNNISGFVDDIEAIKQMIYKTLNTERYQFLAYSWNYGVYTVDLFGKSIPYVCSELKRRITDALTIDDRVTAVDGFLFEKDRGQVLAKFTVHTILGDIESEKVVNV